MGKKDNEALKLLNNCLAEQNGVDNQIGQLASELGARETMSATEAAEFVGRALTAERNAGWALEDLGRLDFFGVKGRRLSLPAEAFVLALARGGVQEASANVLATIVLELAGGELPTRGESYTAKAIAKLNQVQAWKQRYDSNGFSRKIRRAYRKWITRRSGAKESPSGRDIDSRVDSVETGLRRIYMLDNIDFMSVPGLSALTGHAIKTSPYHRGLDLLSYVAEGGAKPDGVFGYREVILEAASREIQLGQVNASYAVCTAKSLLAAIRAAAYFLTSKELKLAGDIRGSEYAAVALNEDLRRARETLRLAAQHAWCDRFFWPKRVYSRPPFETGVGPDEIEQYVRKLSEIIGFSDNKNFVEHQAGY
jgi:hypothetical protein